MNNLELYATFLVFSLIIIATVVYLDSKGRDRKKS